MNKNGMIIMKRVVLICLFLVLAILSTGCKSGKFAGVQLDIPVEGISNDIDDYQVNIMEYVVNNEENNSFTVKYAQISNLSNKSLEDQINETLKLSINEWINKDCEWVEKLQIDIKCKTPKYLSICYRVEWENPQGEDFLDTFTRIGITVDMQTGKRVFLNDLISDTADLKQELTNYNYGNEISPPIDSVEADKIIHYASIPETKYLEEIYNTDPLVYDYITSYLRVKSSFYLTDNQLVITRDENEFDDIYIDYKQ
jgi:hypothetical protein